MLINSLVKVFGFHCRSVLKYHKKIFISTNFCHLRHLRYFRTNRYNDTGTLSPNLSFVQPSPSFSSWLRTSTQNGKYIIMTKNSWSQWRASDSGWVLECRSALDNVYSITLARWLYVMIIITSINHTQILCYDVFISIFACQIPGQRYLLLIIFYITASIPLILILKSNQLQNTLIMLLALLSTCMVITYSG